MKVKTLKKILEQFEDDDDILILNPGTGKVKEITGWSRGENELILRKYNRR